MLVWCTCREDDQAMGHAGPILLPTIRRLRLSRMSVPGQLHCEDFMGNDFDKFLEDLAKAPQPEAAPEAAAEPAPDAPIGPVDPFAHLIGHGGPIQDKSPFDAFLDDVTDTAPPQEEEEPQYEQHTWKTIRETLYEEDYYVWRCEKCFKQINVQRSETINDACKKYNIDPNCGLQVIGEIQNS